MFNDKFSVLMSVYEKDNPQWLKEAIESVLNQTRKPTEVIIALDGPVGKDIDIILQEYVKDNEFIKIIKFPQNRGRGALLHDTVPLCTYALVALMDSDDLSDNKRFEKQLEIFRSNPDLDILGGFIKEIDGSTKEYVAIRKVPITQADIIKFIKLRSPFNQVTVMFKKESIIKIGGYSNIMRFAQDYHLWIRAVANNLTLQNTDNILAEVRVDKKMFGRRGGYKYFKLNKVLLDELLKYSIINHFEYVFNLLVRFCIQVLLTNKMRSLFYKNILRNR